LNRLPVVGAARAVSGACGSALPLFEVPAGGQSFGVASQCPVCAAEIPDDAPDEVAAQDFDVSIPGFEQVKCPNCGSKLRRLRRRHFAADHSDWWALRPY
jgi:hypothetical protein